MVRPGCTICYLTGGVKMERNRAIDYEKGFIVAVMVLCHMIQFFERRDLYPEQYWIMTVINSIAFPAFLFAYGRSVWLAYYRGSLRDAAPRMLRSALRAYGAYCVSGTAYQVICAGRDFSSETVLRVITLRDVPGWSEFLAAFAAFGLAALLLFPALQKLLERKLWVGAVVLVCLACTFLPYDRIPSTHLGLFIGTTSFACFPVLQYFPFFLAGLYAGRYGMERKLLWLGGAGLLSAAGIAYFAANGEPSRFPPSLWWMLLPCLALVLLDWGAEALNRLSGQRPEVRRVLSPIESMGRNSLYYLVASNLAIFSVSRMGTLPLSRHGEVFPFTLPMNSTPWAMFWTLVLLLGIAFVSSLCRKAPKMSGGKSERRR